MALLMPLHHSVNGLSIDEARGSSCSAQLSDGPVYVLAPLGCDSGGNHHLSALCGHEACGTRSNLAVPSEPFPESSSSLIFDDKLDSGLGPG